MKANSHSVRARTLGCNTVRKSHFLPRALTLIAAIAAVQVSACALEPTESESEVSSINHPLVAIPATPETTDKSGVEKWTFHQLPSRSSVLIGWGVVDGDYKVISQMRVYATPEGGLDLNYGRGRGHYVVDKDGKLVAGEALPRDLEINAMFDHDLQAYGEQPYGCAGTILQGLGGIAVALGSCAAIVPSIAVAPLTPLTAAICAAGLGLIAPGAVVGIIEDCGEGAQRNYHISPAPESTIRVDFCFGTDTCVTQPETVYFDEGVVLQCLAEAPACG